MVQKHITRLIDEFRFLLSLRTCLLILPKLVRVVLNDQLAMSLLDVIF